MARRINERLHRLADQLNTMVGDEGHLNINQAAESTGETTGQIRAAMAILRRQGLDLRPARDMGRCCFRPSNGWLPTEVPDRFYKAEPWASEGGELTGDAMLARVELWAVWRGLTRWGAPEAGGKDDAQPDSEHDWRRLSSFSCTFTNMMSVDCDPRTGRITVLGDLRG